MDKIKQLIHEEVRRRADFILTGILCAENRHDCYAKDHALELAIKDVQTDLEIILDDLL